MYNSVRHQHQKRAASRGAKVQANGQATGHSPPVEGHAKGSIEEATTSEDDRPLVPKTQPKARASKASKFSKRSKAKHPRTKHLLANGGNEAQHRKATSGCKPAQPRKDARDKPMPVRHRRVASESQRRVSIAGRTKRQPKPKRQDGKSSKEKAITEPTRGKRNSFKIVGSNASTSAKGSKKAGNGVQAKRCLLRRSFSKGVLIAASKKSRDRRVKADKRVQQLQDATVSS